MNRGSDRLLGRGIRRGKWPLKCATILTRGAAALVAPRARSEYGCERLAKAVPTLATRVRRVGILVARILACTSAYK